MNKTKSLILATVLAGVAITPAVITATNSAESTIGSTQQVQVAKETKEDVSLANGQVTYDASTSGEIKVTWNTNEQPPNTYYSAYVLNATIDGTEQTFYHTPVEHHTWEGETTFTDIPEGKTLENLRFGWMMTNGGYVWFDSPDNQESLTTPAAPLELRAVTSNLVSMDEVLYTFEVQTHGSIIESSVLTVTDGTNSHDFNVEVVDGVNNLRIHTGFFKSDITASLKITYKVTEESEPAEANANFSDIITTEDIIVAQSLFTFTDTTTTSTTLNWNISLFPTIDSITSMTINGLGEDPIAIDEPSLTGSIELTGLDPNTKYDSLTLDITYGYSNTVKSIPITEFFTLPLAPVENTTTVVEAVADDGLAVNIDWDLNMNDTTLSGIVITANNGSGTSSFTVPEDSVLADGGIVITGLTPDTTYSDITLNISYVGADGINRVEEITIGSDFVTSHAKGEILNFEIQNVQSDSVNVVWAINDNGNELQSVVLTGNQEGIDEPFEVNLTTAIVGNDVISGLPSATTYTNLKLTATFKNSDGTTHTAESILGEEIVTAQTGPIITDVAYHVGNTAVEVYYKIEPTTETETHTVNKVELVLGSGVMAKRIALDSENLDHSTTPVKVYGLEQATHYTNVRIEVNYDEDKTVVSDSNKFESTFSTGKYFLFSSVGMFDSTLVFDNGIDEIQSMEITSAKLGEIYSGPFTNTIIVPSDADDLMATYTLNNGVVLPPEHVA